jgi:hypothetical protein
MKYENQPELVLETRLGRFPTISISDDLWWRCLSQCLKMFSTNFRVSWSVFCVLSAWLGGVGTVAEIERKLD